MRGITGDEKALLLHVAHWGSAGYPISKLGRGWTWGPWRSVKAHPVMFRTKKKAVESFEIFLEILADAKAGRI